LHNRFAIAPWYCILEPGCQPSILTKKGSEALPFIVKPGAGNETRTRDLNLGKVALYQLSYSRRSPQSDCSPTLLRRCFVVLLKLAVYAGFGALRKPDWFSQICEAPQNGPTAAFSA
jgi:hypothetical protein